MIDVTFEADKNRAAAYDEGTEVGECTFVVRDNVWIINHTFVTPSYGGRGIAKSLVAKVSEHAREEGVKVLPLCPFAQKEYEENEEYHDLWAK